MAYYSSVVVSVLVSSPLRVPIKRQQNVLKPKSKNLKSLRVDLNGNNENDSI